MGDDDLPDALRTEFPQQSDGALLDAGIQTEQGFVGKQHLRAGGQGLCLADQLLLTTGELTHAALSQACGADTFQKLIHIPLGCPALPEHPMG